MQNDNIIMDREKSLQELIEERLAATGRPPLNKKGWKSAQDLFNSEVGDDKYRTPEEIRLLDISTMRGYHPIDDRRPWQFGVKTSNLFT